MTEAGPDKGEIRDGAHHWNVRVHYADTDAAGVVYYANYLVFAERARAEAMRCLGADLGGLKSEGFQFVVRTCRMDYRRPARLDEALEVITRVEEVKRASFSMSQEIRRKNERLVSISLRLACIDKQGAPVRFPPDLASRLEALGGS